MKANKFGIAIVGVLLTGVLMLSSAMGAEDVASEFSWDAFDPNFLPEAAAVPDISGEYSCIEEGFAVDMDENLAIWEPYQEDNCTMTIEQHGSLLLVTYDEDGVIFKGIGSVAGDDLMILWMWVEEVDGETLYFEEVSDCDILDSGEIVYNSLGTAYDEDDFAVATFAETGVFTPVPAVA